MKGNTVGELAVHIEFGGGPLPTPIWTKVRDDRNGWTNVRINVRFDYISADFTKQDVMKKFKAKCFIAYLYDNDTPRINLFVFISKCSLRLPRDF